MKIAIVAPSPIPFTIGGVEYLMMGLLEHMNSDTDHQVELIKLPSNEDSFWNLIESYEKYYNLNLDHFDLVISTKYPTWMVQHRNQICYVMHRLRGLYDTYHFTNLPPETDRENRDVNKVLDYIHSETCYNLNDFFDVMKKLKERESSIPGRYFDFPGSFIREIVHFMDDFALAKDKIKKYYCLSNTVAKRKDYFPAEVMPVVVYPPSYQKTYKNTGYKHIFTVSRLDGPKRIGLLIEAMKLVKADIPVYIAGTGPDEARLKELAKDDKRIHFLGFASDDEIHKYYADSLFIPYFPYDEDYGLITIEAMCNHKPVLTLSDSGGPTEFVQQNVNGFIADPDPRSIAKYINKICSMSETEIREMGDAAYETVKDITWESTIGSLLSDIDVLQQNAKRKRITVLSTFPIYPPLGGGQARSFHIYKNIASQFNIEIVSFANEGKDMSSEISKNLVETRTVRSREHAEAEIEIEKCAEIPITDIAMITLSKKTKAYGEKLKKSIEKSDFVVLSHPYLYNEARKYIGDRPLIYEAQDIEYILKRHMLKKCDRCHEFLQQIYEVEKRCCIESAFIMTCSEDDRRELADLYEISTDKIIVVPNGVDTKSIQFIDIKERIYNKKILGIENEKAVLFMGSWHQPNLDACEEIFQMAEKTPDIKYLLMGSQCMYFANKLYPDNVGMLGLLSEKEKQQVFNCVDFAINPMMSGSGTNLKMFEYMAAGIPVISTTVGTRGIDRKDVMVIAENDEMPDVITKLNITDLSDMVQEARIYVEKVFDWRVIAQPAIQKFEDIGM